MMADIWKGLPFQNEQWLLMIMKYMIKILSGYSIQTTGWLDLKTSLMYIELIVHIVAVSSFYAHKMKWKSNI